MAYEDEWRLLKSPLNYTGNKFQLLDTILPLFPTKIKTFYDLCSGGGDVGANVTWADNVIAMDVQSDVIDLLNLIQEMPSRDFIEEVDKISASFGLSQSAIYSPGDFMTATDKHFTAFNKEQFKELRDAYNAKIVSDPKILTLYFFTLIAFSFNNQIRFNSAGEFNISGGKSDFNKSMRSRLVEFSRRIKKIDITYINDSMYSIESIEFGPHDFLYIDPPYLITMATYNKGWTEKEEEELLQFLTRMDKDGVRFALSNVTVHKGRRNELLIEWAKGFRVRDLDFNYDNSSYQGKNTDEKTVEVLIRNY